MSRHMMKTYEDKKHALAFIHGTMFANPLSYFKQLEDKNIRQDTEEGIMTMPLTEGFKLELKSSALSEPIVMNRYDLVEPLTLQTKWFDAINLFCMHMIDIQRRGNTVSLKIPLRSTHFGRYAVVILHVQEFIRRVKNAVSWDGYQLSYKLVEYYDSTTGIHTNLTTLEPIFTKRNEYQEEQEFRIVIDRGLAVPTPMKLDISPIQDIAKLIVLRDPVSYD